MAPLTDDYKIAIESRIPDSLVIDAARLGLLVEPLLPYSAGMGSFQMSWRDENRLLHATAGPRRAGAASGL
jgi:hypothetical protein